jgi:hypothetical protein
MFRHHLLGAAMTAFVAIFFFCVSATLAEKVEDFKGRPIGDLLLRGKSEAFRAFEPLRVEQYNKQYNNPATKNYLQAFLPSWKRAILVGLQLSLPTSAGSRMISLRAFTSSAS